MLRHPNIVRTTIAAELSWNLGKTVALADIVSKNRHGSEMSDLVSTSSGTEELEF